MQIPTIHSKPQTYSLRKCLCKSARKNAVIVVGKSKSAKSEDIILNELKSLRESLISDPNNKYLRELLEEKMQILYDTSIL